MLELCVWDIPIRTDFIELYGVRCWDLFRSRVHGVQQLHCRNVSAELSVVELCIVHLWELRNLCRILNLIQLHVVLCRSLCPRRIEFVQFLFVRLLPAEFRRLELRPLRCRFVLRRRRRELLELYCRYVRG